MKTKFTQWFNQQGISFFISLVILLIITSVCLTFYGKSLVKQHLAVQQQVMTIRNALQTMHTHVNNADLGLRGYMIIKDEKFLIPFNDAKQHREENLDLLDHYLTLQHYPNLGELQTVRTTLDNYFLLIEDMVSLRSQDQLDSILQVLAKDPGYDTWKVYSTFTEEVIAFEQNIEAASQSTYEATMQGVVLVQFLLLSVGGLCGYLSFVALKTEKARRKLFGELDTHNRKLIFDDTHLQSQQDENVIMHHLIANLQKAFVFIRAIAAGNYAVEWEGLTQQNQAANQQNLVGELIQMREKMKQVKAADEQRLWATEALTKVNYITRLYQHDVTQLADELLRHMVNSLQANQAGIFIIDDAHQSLEMVSCYAYERKKFLKKSIAVGEGLVGQAYLEAETMYLTEVPPNYILMTSGLGKANPRSILIVPLRYNEEVMGVLEIASFKLFEPYQIAWVENAGEIIASSLSTVRNSEKMRGFLEQSEEQAEMLRSQEEEMRQNMEEMQSTQEEMQRISSEMGEQLKVINTTLATIEFDLTGTIKDANDNFLQLMGYDKAAIIGKHHSIFVDKEERSSQEYEAFWEMLASGQPFDGEFRRIANGGKEVWIKGVYSPMFNKHGEPVKVIKFAYDITDEKQQQEIMQQQSAQMHAQKDELYRMMTQMQEKEMLLSTLMNASPEAIFVIDQQHCLLDSNSAFKNMIRHRAIQIEKGEAVFSLFSKDDISKHKLLCDRVYSGEAFEDTLQIAEALHRAYYSPLKNNRDEIYACAVFIKDIKELSYTKAQHKPKQVTV